MATHLSTAVTRDRICEAAVRIAIRDGLLSMTLENVAREAGFTKGGVMYHFPSKEELIRGVLEYFSQQCETMLMRKVADDPEPRMRWARCMVDCLFPENAGSTTGLNDRQSLNDSQSEPDDGPLSSEVLGRFFMATLAGAVTSPGTMQPLRELAARMRTRFARDPRDGIEQLLVWLTIDGLFLWQFMGLIDSEDPVIHEVGQALRKRVQPQPDSLGENRPEEPDPSLPDASASDSHGAMER